MPNRLPDTTKFLAESAGSEMEKGKWKMGTAGV
jgi:hypothetical protein